jgi:two-component system chemotaxis sensor kinase CheA
MSDAQENSHDDLLDSLLGDFLDESDQLLTQLNERLLQLDGWVHALDDGQREPCDPNLLNEMFRAAHSLKGLSAMLGLTDINSLTHKIENVFDAARKNELTVDGDVTELVFMGLDRLVALIDRLKEPEGEPVDCGVVVESIRQLLQTAGVERKQSSQADAERAMRADPSTPGAAECSPVPQAEVDEVSCPAPCAAPDPSPAGNADPLENIQDEDEIPDKYLSIFIDETETTLEGLTGALLALEGGANGDDLKSLMGSAHKIKGSAASIGLNRIAKLAHLMEDLLEELIQSSGSLSAGMTDVLLKCTDALQQQVAALKQGSPRSDQFGQLARELLSARSAPSATTACGRVAYAGEVTFQPSLPAAGLKARIIHEKLAKLGDLSACDPSPEKLDDIEHLDCFRFRLTTDQPLEAVKNGMQVAGVLKVNVEPLGIGEETTVGSNAGRIANPSYDQPVANSFHQPIGNPSSNEADLPDGLPIRPTEKPAPIPSPALGETPQTRSPAGAARQEGEQRGSESSQRPTETVRVDIDRLDHLMDLAGQLVINRAQFAQIGDKLRAAMGYKQSAQALNRVSAELERMGGQIALRPDGQHPAGVLEGIHGHLRRVQSELEPLRREVQTFSRAHELVEELFEAIHQLGRVSDGIQQSVMDTRMVPIGPLFARFKRVVRDITRSTGKQARLEIRGENTELDKRMIDELGDPLVHLVRNSVDHGIEPPEVREAAGKPREGTVTLDAFHRGNSIVIEVRDDGKGLDAGRILRKCLEKGLVTKADAEKMTPQQIYQKIWEPGLSTAEKVTEVSGRGMGMDIVKSKIEELSGTADINSVPGQGTTITLKLPLTLAILPSLMVEIRGDVFAIPLEAVVEIVSVARNQVSSVQGRQMASVRGRVVSLLRLGDLLAFHGAGGAESRQPAETTLVIVGSPGEEVGLAVDRVIGEEDVVIKSIAENFENVRGIAGASILGDGRVSLILDIASLFAIVSEKAVCSTR